MSVTEKKVVTMRERVTNGKPNALKPKRLESAKLKMARLNLNKLDFSQEANQTTVDTYYTPDLHDFNHRYEVSRVKEN